MSHFVNLGCERFSAYYLFFKRNCNFDTTVFKALITHRLLFLECRVSTSLFSVSLSADRQNKYLDILSLLK